MKHTELFKSGRKFSVWGAYGLTVIVLIVIGPWALAQYDYPLYKTFLALSLMSICLYPTARYFAYHESGLPVLAILCLSYAAQFALPIFIRDPIIKLVTGPTYLREVDIEHALILSCLGVMTLQFGYYKFSKLKVLKNIPVIQFHLNKKRALIFCIVVGALSPLVPAFQSALPENISLQISAIIYMLMNQLLVVIGILGWIVYSGEGTRWHKFLLYSIVVLAAIRGASSGFIEQAAMPIAVLFTMEWIYKKRIPIRKISVLILIFLFLTPVKQEFRKATWFESSELSMTDKAFLWFDKALDHWEETISNRKSVSSSTEQAFSRLDIIHQFAHVYSLTPNGIPFQYGTTYSYFTVALIPRFLWPDKPLSGSANTFFAVNYGLTTEEGAQRTTFGVSLLAESYINFSVLGVIFIMALQGGILSFLKHLFGDEKSGPGAQSIFIAFYVFFLNGIGSSAEMMFGNILQLLLGSCALLLWARKKQNIAQYNDSVTGYNLKPRYIS